MLVLFAELVADVLACRRAEVPAGEGLPTLGPAERTHRRRPLEPDTPAGRQRSPNLYVILQEPQAKGPKVRMPVRSGEPPHRHP